MATLMISYLNSHFPLFLVLQASPLSGRTVPDFGQMYHIKGSHKRCFILLSFQWLLSFGLIISLLLKVWSHYPMLKSRNHLKAGMIYRGREAELITTMVRFFFSSLMFLGPVICVLTWCIKGSITYLKLERILEVLLLSLQLPIKYFFQSKKSLAPQTLYKAHDDW